MMPCPGRMFRNERKWAGRVIRHFREGGNLAATLQVFFG